MYGISPARPIKLGCNLVQLSGRDPVMPLAGHRERHLSHILSQLVFEIACQTLEVDTGYAVEKALSGAGFLPDDHDRWWEQLGCGRINLLRALRGPSPRARRQIHRLDGTTDAATNLLSMPLWLLSTVDGVTVDLTLSARPAVEAMVGRVPSFPAYTPASTRQFVGELMEPLNRTTTTWAALNTAVFCLRLAHARQDLVFYTLTYEALMSTEWDKKVKMNAPPLFAAAWRDLKCFYAEWFSTLEITVTHEEDFWEAAEHLESAGISMKITHCLKSKNACNNHWRMHSDGLESFHVFRVL